MSAASDEYRAEARAFLHQHRWTSFLLGAGWFLAMFLIAIVVLE